MIALSASLTQLPLAVWNHLVPNNIKEKMLLTTGLVCTVCSRSRFAAVGFSAMYMLYKQLKGEIQTQASAYQQLVQEAARRDQAHGAWQKSSDDRNKGFYENLLSANGQIRTQAERIGFLEETLDDANADNRRKDAEISLLNERVLTAEQKITDLNERLVGAHETIAQCKAEIQELNQLNFSLAQQNNHQLGEIQSLQHRIGSMQTTLSQQTQDIAKLSQELQTAQGEIGLRDQHNARLTSEIRQLEESLSSAQTTIQNLQTTISRLKSCIQVQTQEISGLNHVLNQFRQQTSALSSFVFKLQRDEAEQRELERVWTNSSGSASEHTSRQTIKRSYELFNSTIAGINDLLQLPRAPMSSLRSSTQCVPTAWERLRHITEPLVLSTL